MHEEQVFLMALAMLLGTGTFVYLVHTIKSAILSRGKGRNDDALLQEMRALRAEMHALRQQNNEVVLSLDSSLDRMDRRFSHLEARIAADERQHVGSGR